MRIGLIAVLLVACGEVENKSVDAPKPIDAAIDSPSSCTDMTSINSCGPTCAVCTTTGDREVATCNGAVCGIACDDGAPRCSDNSCSRVLFDFNSMTLEGASVHAPVGLVLAVRSFMGSPALAIDVTNLSEVGFRVPVCLSGTLGLSTQTLTAKVYFQGTPTTGGQYYVQPSVPTPQTGAYLPTQTLDAGQMFTYSASMSASNMSATTTFVTLKAGTLGAAFSGTIWFDDIKIQ